MHQNDIGSGFSTTVLFTPMKREGGLLYNHLSPLGTRVCAQGPTNARSIIKLMEVEDLALAIANAKAKLHEGRYINGCSKQIIVTNISTSQHFSFICPTFCPAAFTEQQGRKVSKSRVREVVNEENTLVYAHPLFTL